MSRVAVLNCASGASGDMLLGALCDLGLDPAVLEEGLRRLPLPGLKIEAAPAVRQGLHATKFTASFAGAAPAFRTLSQVKEALRGSALDPALAREAERLFERLAAAEAAAHGSTPGTVHFHELGDADTLVDVVGTLIGWKALGIARAWSGPVNLGGGSVRTAHGVFPVPAPATARLLEGRRVLSGDADGELTTPTGALLLSHLCEPGGAPPDFVLERSGYGAGDRDFPDRPNCLQVLLGRAAAEVVHEQIAVLETNVDDLNPQVLGHVVAHLLEAGALDAFLTPVLMKKGRPGFQVTVLAPPAREADFGAMLFRETGTLGYRVRRTARRALVRQVREVTVVGGTVRVKVASLGGEQIHFAPEYEDCRRVAEKTGRPLREVMEEVLRRRP